MTIVADDMCSNGCPELRTAGSSLCYDCAQAVIHAGSDQSAPVLDAPAVVAWGLVHSVLARGWGIAIKHHPDRSGPNGRPLDPDEPMVYSVLISKSGTERHAKGRSALLEEALAMACGDLADIEMEQR